MALYKLQFLSLMTDMSYDQRLQSIA